MKIEIDRTYLLYPGGAGDGFYERPAREVRAVCARCSTLLFSTREKGQNPAPEKTQVEGARKLALDSVARRCPPCGNSACKHLETLVTLQVHP